MLTLNGLKYKDSYKYVQLFSMATDIDIDKNIRYFSYKFESRIRVIRYFVSISSYARW